MPIVKTSIAMAFNFKYSFEWANQCVQIEIYGERQLVKQTHIHISFQLFLVISRLKFPYFSAIAEGSPTMDVSQFMMWKEIEKKRNMKYKFMLHLFRCVCVFNENSFQKKCSCNNSYDAYSPWVIIK